MSVGRLAGKIAVVTGGASGIGKAICSRFANEGANVVMVDRQEDKLKKARELLTTAHGNEHLQLNGDVCSSKFANVLFSDIKERYGRPSNVLVNCAGIVRDSLFVNMSEESFDEVINTNLKSVFIMTKAFVTSLKCPGGMDPASIVNISSIIGKTGNIGQTNYAASKAGVIAFTKNIGIELGRFGVRCNAVLPGFIKTPMTEGLPKKNVDMVLKIIPMKRMGTPEEIANACLFLSSDESSYVNCVAFEVAGWKRKTKKWSASGLAYWRVHLVA